jgi:TRAP-type C4-dicarboxylate transport system substrate-binding protein
MASFWWYSEKGWQRLPPDVQQAVRESFVELAAATRRAAKDREAPALAAFKAGGGTVDEMTPAQRAEFRAATAPLRDWYSARYPGDWLRRVDGAVAACEASAAPPATAATVRAVPGIEPTP